MAGMATFTPSQDEYRFYEDGALASSTALGTQSTPFDRTIVADNLIHLRIQIQENGGASSVGQAWQLQYQRNGMGGFANVNASSSYVRSADGTPTDNSAVTSSRLTGGSGSFDNGKYDEVDGLHASGANVILSANNYTEFVFSLGLQYADLADNDTLTFRLLVDGATFTYNVTPTLTIDKQSAPTVALNSPADEATVETDTPTLEFTGTDGEGDDVRYNVQVTNTIDLYHESNSSGQTEMNDSTYTDTGQSFLGNGTDVGLAAFYVRKVGSPAGNVTAKIYALGAGTHGNDARPSNGASPLATSDTVTALSFPTSVGLVEFTFSGANQITLADGTVYIVTVSYSGGTGTDYIEVYADISAPGHQGNRALQLSGAWSGNNFSDHIFYILPVGVDLVDAVLLDKVSNTDSGFLNTVNGGDTDPFTSGQKVSYTVQSGDELDDGTYYWRVRGLDPSGSSTYGAWSETRSFTVDSGGDGSQTLVAPQIASTTTLYSPTVTPQAVNLTAPHIDSTTALHAPVVTATYDLTAPFISSTTALHAPTVSVGSVNLTVPHITSTATPYAPTVAVGAVDIEVPHIDSTTTLYSPSVAAGAVSLSLPHVVSTTTLYAPTVIADQVLELPHIESTTDLYAPVVGVEATELLLPYIESVTTLYAPTVEAGVVTLAAPFISSATQVFAPTVTAGTVNLSLPHISSAEQVYTPSVGVETIELEAPFISSTTTLYSPTLAVGSVDLDLPHIESAAQLYAPALAGEGFISVPFLASTTELYPPELVADQLLELPLIASTTTLHPPTVEAGAVTLDVPAIESTTNLYAPSVAIDTYNLSPPLIASLAEAFPPTVSLGEAPEQFLTVPHIASETAVYTPTVVIEAVNLQVPHVDSTTVLYGPTLTVGGVEILLPFLASTSILYGPIVTLGELYQPVEHVTVRGGNRATARGRGNSATVRGDNDASARGSDMAGTISGRR